MIHPIIPITRCGDLTFHANGRIDITAQVSMHLHLSEGDILDIAVSDDTIKEYYLYVAHRADEILGRHTCRCHVVKGQGHYMRMFSKRLATYMLQETQTIGKVTMRTGELRILPTIGRAISLIMNRAKPSTNV